MGRLLLHDAALADGRSDRLRLGVSMLLTDGAIEWIRPSDDEGPGARDAGVTVIDASGSTIVPGLVDCHSHITMPGGAHWIERASDPPDQLLAAAEENGRLLTQAGVRWARDVGAPIATDPADGRTRAMSLGVRDRWTTSDGRPKPGRPYIRAAGTWLDKAGTLPGTGSFEAADADELVAGAVQQLDDGADLVKLYLDGPEPGVAPWSADEVARVVTAVHGRGARITAHSTTLAGARVGVDGGVDALEHGMELDADLCAAMARQGTFLVSTLTVFRSWRSFGATTSLPRFTSADGRRRLEAREARAVESVKLARVAGVSIATGTDFGGGSARANQLAWEVELLVAAGLEPWEALTSATWRGGELLGEPEAGRVREGGPADLVLVHGDPLSDPTALWRVWWVAWADARASGPG